MTTFDSTPGWKPDPGGRHELRYYDGAWTDHVSDGGVAAVDPLPALAPARPTTPAPEPQPIPVAAAPVAARPASVSARGAGGSVTVDEQWVTITRKGLIARGAGHAKGEKRIPIRSVTAVQLKKPGLQRGFIQFTVSGESGVRGGAKNALEDENSVLMAMGEYDAFVAVKDFVEEQIVLRDRPAQAQQVIHQAAAPSLGAQLTELAELRDAGILSDAEFEAQKAKLLAG